MIHQILQTALCQKKRALSEYESKLLLAAYDIPVAQEILVQSPAEALAAAEKIGYPVALKACSPDLMHKTEAGVIELNVASDKELISAFERIRSVAPVALEGVLVAEMVPGIRELVMGMHREPQFGPCIMLGLGGVMAEILNDAVIRVAPFDKLEALDMAWELKCRKMLDAFRGEKAANMDQICRALAALGDIGIHHPEIEEIDINPVKIDGTGNIKAVDALVILKGGRNASP